MKISAIVIVAGLLGMVIFTTGCVQEQQSDVGMAVEFNDHAACAHVAKEKGWYKEEGLNFTAYESYATGIRLASALARGDIQVAYICLSPGILAYSRGVNTSPKTLRFGV
jgi:NitT/TauT family transport system substrate-binding protein